MSKQCPYCQKELKDEARFCIGCGRQLGGETTDVASTALSDLKGCYGSFPNSKMECYLCADEGKCSAFTSALQDNALREQVQELSEQFSQLSQLVSQMCAQSEHNIKMLDLINDNIVMMNNNICKAFGGR